MIIQEMMKNDEKIDKIINAENIEWDHSNTQLGPGHGNNPCLRKVAEPVLLVH